MRRSKTALSYTGILILANVVFFIFALRFLESVALQPSEVLVGKGLWTFITSMFMHGGLGHLFVNMVSLMFIGGFVEKLIGGKRFLSLYLFLYKVYHQLSL